MRQELHQAAAAAASAKLAMHNEMHEVQLSTSKESAAMLYQIAQLEQQVSALESDKAAVIHKCEKVSAEMTQVNSQATSKEHTVEQMQVSVEDQRMVREQTPFVLELSCLRYTTSIRTCKP